MNFDRIYLDHAATTPLRSEVAAVIAETSLHAGFNASSLHFEGRRARAAIDDARDRVAKILGAKRTEVVFTSGGTEADNLALMGAGNGADSAARVVASAVEHHAVLAALERLQEDPTAPAFLHVDASGRVDPQEFEKALVPRPRCVSVMYANNEVGTIQPIARLARIAAAASVPFHTDAVAAAAWLPLDTGKLGVDMMSLSAHKIGGPKGVGALFIREGLPLRPTMLGGGQESGRRSGTENVAGIAGFALALELAVAERAAAAATTGALRDRLETAIAAAVPGMTVNGAGAPRLPNISNISFDGVEAGELLVALDLEGVATSAGSACTSGSLQTSHVLAAMYPDSPGRSGIRFSLGARTTAGEIDRVIALLPPLVTRLREHSAYAAPLGGIGRLETHGARLWRQKL
ncbi:MAG TPA: cysteine desulfurase family protein [Candidatus Cybelea sp.]|nr:cysteine desulfurase family protein [Candidatus Cybelea sp.]